MKNQLTSTLLFLLAPIFLIAQASGNINYHQQTQLPDKHINTPLSSPKDFAISVKGLYNLQADNYVAIFNLLQVGSNSTEVNRLIDERIKPVEAAVNKHPNTTFFIDMISFVPVYEYEVEKKVFSKKTYNEVPKGFAVQKNLHIGYNDPDFLNTLIAICADAEIYDLIRVDYSSDSLSQAKETLRSEADKLLEAKLQRYKTLTSNSLNDFDKHLVESVKILYPIEQYQSYQASSNAALPNTKSANIQQAQKMSSLYYQPIIPKEFDFVVNATIVEPVIQVVYEVKIGIKQQPNSPTTTTIKEKQYFFITPTGDIKPLPIK